MTTGPVNGKSWAAMPPGPHHIRSWQDAEVNAAAWMRSWGYMDAELTTSGADGGIDVRSSRALAQVKYLAAAVGRPDLQRLIGAAATVPGVQLMFFTGSDYSATAVEFAGMVNMALFRYGLDGAVTPVNETARWVMRQSAQGVRVPAIARQHTRASQPFPQSTPDWKWRLKNGGWYLALPMFSAGVFAAVPFWHAYIRLGRPQLRVRAVGFSVAGIVIFALFGFAPKNDHGEAVGALGNALENIATVVALIVIFVACVQLAAVRREIFTRPGWTNTPGTDPHIAVVEEARARRRAARELQEKDPATARELGIGRPDLGRGYDDGGLVNVNTAPAAVIAEVCGLTAAQAEAIVVARSGRERFYGVGEVFIDVSLSDAEQSELRERLVL